LRALVEATLDFPEEEIDFLEKADAAGRLQRVRAALDDVLLRSQQGAVLREGLHVVLVGAPNVGKSSLLNALAGEEAAIVTAVPGTTRDRIVRQVEVAGLPLDIIDTAGLRGYPRRSGEDRHRSNAGGDRARRRGAASGRRPQAERGCRRAGARRRAHAARPCRC